VRIDVAHGLYKADGLPDLVDTRVEPMRLRGNPLACDQEEVHEVYRRWRAIADAYEPERVLVGEVNLAPARAERYVRADELHQAFAFAFLAAPWDAECWRSAIEGLLAGAARTGSPVTWAVENHDVVRSPTRYGARAQGRARARAALLAVLALPGSAYLYQGQELGLPEVDVPPQHRQDPAWLRSGVSRDGARVPLPWTTDPAGAHGFSSRPECRPWLPVPGDASGVDSGVDWGELSVQAQKDDPGSTLTLATAALRLRRRLHRSGTVSGADQATVRTTGEGLLVVDRPGLRLVVNMGAAPVALPPGEVLLSSGPLDGAGSLPTDTAAWLAVSGR